MEGTVMSFNLCISGVYGRMGKILYQMALHDQSIDRVIGIDKSIPKPADGVFGPSRIVEALAGIGVLVIFTNNPDTVYSQAEKAAERGIKVVIATTGLSPQDISDLHSLDEKTAILQANNFSLGVSLLTGLAKKAAQVLPSAYQVEIVEEHHGRKLDAPSGTAITLAQAVCNARELDPDVVIQCGRSGREEATRSNDIVGVQSVRAGNIAGNHDVIFAGPREILRLRHEAQSPEVFAEGSLHVAKWIFDQPAGWYTMEDVLDLSV